MLKRTLPPHPLNQYFYIQKVPEIAMGYCFLEAWYLPSASPSLSQLGRVTRSSPGPRRRRRPLPRELAGGRLCLLSALSFHSASSSLRRRPAPVPPRPHR